MMNLPLAFIDFTFIDLLDILLVGIIIFQLYKLTRGTVAIRIFFGILAIYLLWKLVSALQMEMLGEILGQFIGVGVIALMIVFQKELRRFLLFIGNREFLNRRGPLLQSLFGSSPSGNAERYDAVVTACEHFSQTKTGALIIIARDSDPAAFIRSARKVDARLSSVLLESIFFKNSPLHDGAVLIRNRRIVSASGVLPVTENENIMHNLGMRHRAALGISEQTDAIAVVVSEETGTISYAIDGVLHRDVSPTELKNVLNPNE